MVGLVVAGRRMGMRVEGVEGSGWSGPAPTAGSTAWRRLSMPGSQKQLVQSHVPSDSGTWGRVTPVHLHSEGVA